MSANMADLNEVNCLEYGLLKIPYELLNKKFQVADLESKLREKTEPLPLVEVAEDVQKLYSRIANFQTEMERSTNDEIEAAESLLQRADYLKEGTSSSPIAAECFRKQRINRFITDHLLRAGYFSTAQRLSEYAGTDDNFQCNKFIFHVAKQLHRLNSTFETEVRIQQCAELIRHGRRLDAINYSKQFFGHLPFGQWKEGNLLSLFGLLGLGIQKSIPNESYQKLLSDERYDSIIDMFRRENQRIFQISSQSPFSACLHAGIAAHKRLIAKEDLDPNAFACLQFQVDLCSKW
uniref:E3 ubiquitin-protein transferase MAEA n=1 Tax=Ditylenchus dipsaci TaxID=166011 RepID=A0A915E646_9BILA